jgi:hypothetical protein
MKFLDRFDDAKKVWELALPTVPIPPNKTLIGWLAVYSDEDFEAAVVRTPYRLSQGSMGRGTVRPEDVYRLVSSLLKDRGRARREKRGQSGDVGLTVKRDNPQSKREEEQWNA